MLTQMVIKQGLALGGLSPSSRGLALAVVWAGLPTEPANEKAINQNLQNQLACAAAFLDTDHVELRRWLVDGGWLQRDGWGRVYQRVPRAGLPADLQALTLALPPGDPQAWVSAQRTARAVQRAARRAAWQGC